MKCVVVALLFVAVNSVKVQEHTFLANIESVDSSKDSPIARVVKLLQEMKAQLDKEVSGDEEAYDKMVCWCETNDKEKTKAIADAEQHLVDLGNTIEELTAASAKLSQEITNLEGEVAENQ